MPAGEADDLAAGERSLHEFFRALYADMYRNPGDYRMAESPDLTFNDGEWCKARPDMKRAMRTNAHAIKSLEVLFEIGRLGSLHGDALVLSAPKLAEIFAKVTPKSISRPRMKGFLGALQKFGLEISGDSEQIMQSTRYPKMLIAMKALCRHGGGDDHQVRLFAFHRCDFRAVEAAYDPDISQVLWVLPEDTCRLADQIIAYMTGSGYQMELKMGGYPSEMWAVQLSGSSRYKASKFFWFGFSIEYLNMFHLSLHCMNPQYLIPLVYAKGSEYIEWFDRLWHRDCTGCGFCKDRFKNPGPYLFEHRGRTRGLCHQNWVEVRNPSREQVQDMLEMVALHTQAGMAQGMRRRARPSER